MLIFLRKKNRRPLPAAVLNQITNTSLLLFFPSSRIYARATFQFCFSRHFTISASYFRLIKSSFTKSIKSFSSISRAIAFATYFCLSARNSFVYLFFVFLYVLYATTYTYLGYDAWMMYQCLLRL